MDRSDLRWREPIIGHPILLILMSFPIACFPGALATDLIYSQSADMMWADFSAWLLAIGMLFGSVAAIVGLARLISNRSRLSRRRLWPFVIASFVVLVLALLDNFVHSRDAWTSVVPTGLTLSAATVVAMLATVVLGSVLGYRGNTSAPRAGEMLR